MQKPPAGLDLSVKQAERLLRQLPVSVRIHLVRQWEQETWPARFRQLLARVDRHLRNAPHLAKDALKTVGPARRALYAGRRRH